MPNAVTVRASWGPSIATPLPADALKYASDLEIQDPGEISPTGRVAVDHLMLHAIVTAKAALTTVPGNVSIDWTLPWQLEHEVDGGNPGTWNPLPRSLIYAGSYMGTTRIFIGVSYT